MRKSIHIILLILSLLAAGVCGWLVPQVNVNSDMTKYLPDDSRMKAGLDILTNEFKGASDFQAADVRVLFQGLSMDSLTIVEKNLTNIPDVRGVSHKINRDSTCVLYELIVPKSVDQKSLGQYISYVYGDQVIVETSQDGATPPFSVIIIAAFIILGVLLVMSQSWLDPILVLFVTGVAVIINIGTNALLPSVSITTNYIVAILQLVLSLDYCIVLMNRFRQELSPEVPILDSVNKAIKQASASIWSSALTTVIGLLMLAFMRLKIGLDLGVVLAKGVVCSLICTFTILPSLLLLCHKAICRCQKRTFILPVDRISRFVTHHKLSMAIFSISLFVVTFIFSRKTDIYFNTNGESKIEDVFPSPNPTVLIYNTAEEDKIIPMADSLAKLPGVDMVISYPTLLQRQYTAPELVAYIQRLSVDMKDYMPPMGEGEAYLTPEMVQVVYYLRSGLADSLNIRFADLMNFVRYECLADPLISGMIDKDMRSQIMLLDNLLNLPDEVEEEEEIIAPISSPVQTVVDVPKSVISQPKLNVTRNSRFTIIDVAQRMTDYPYELTRDLRQMVDTTQLRHRMTVRQMADYVGSTVSQTKMVYGFADEGKRMTPIRYVHFLTDDLFQRKALASMVSEEQKQALRSRVAVMDAADHNQMITAQEAAQLLRGFGFGAITDRQVLTLMGCPQEEETITIEPLIAKAETHEESVPVVPQEVVKPKVHQKSKAELQAETMMQLMESHRAYSYTEMAHHFNRLGQKVDAETVRMLYGYYGSRHAYPDTLRMSPEELIGYVTDTLIQNPEIANRMAEEDHQLVDSVRGQLASGIGMMKGEEHSLMVVLTSLPKESDETYQFVDQLDSIASSTLREPYYMIGESAMFSEMKNGFSSEMMRITIIMVAAIFLIVVLTFRSIVVPIILVLTVMTAFYANVIFSGVTQGEILYLAYLIVQSILMGATIDYGILYANYYREFRHTLAPYEAARLAYHGAIRTIMTSGMIMVLGPGVMALLVDDVTISAIVGCISVGALIAILLILFVLPGVLVFFDRLVVGKHALYRKPFARIQRLKQRIKK